MVNIRPGFARTVPPLLHVVNAALIAGASSVVPPGTTHVFPADILGMHVVKANKVRFLVVTILSKNSAWLLFCVLFTLQHLKN